MIVNTKIKDHSIYLSKVALLELNQHELTLLNLFAYYLEEANNIYRTSQVFKKKLCSLYDSAFQIFISNLGKYTRLIYSFSFIDSIYLNDKEYNNLELLDFFEDISSNPLLVKKSFSKRLFNSVKKDYRDDLLAALENPSYQARTCFLNKLLEGTNILLNDAGALADLEEISVDELTSFYFTKIKGLSFNYYTNYEAANGPYLLNKSYSYELKNCLNNPYRIVEEKSLNKECYINMAINTNLYYGADDYLYGFLLNNLIGGGMNSLLFKEIREKYSLCYSIGSRYNSNLGLLMITLITSKENSQRAIALIKELIHNISFTKEEFIIARDQLVDALISKDDYPYSSIIEATTKDYFTYYLTDEEKIRIAKNLSYEKALAKAQKFSLGLALIFGGDDCE